MAHLARTLLALALLPAPLLAQGRTFIVDDNAPGGEFTEIQEAIDRAVAGDLIFVAPGQYAPIVVEGKGLTIIAEDPALTWITPYTGSSTSELNRISDVPEGQTCVVRGLSFQMDDSQFTALSDNLGTVWLEDCDFVTFATSSTGTTEFALSARNCASLVMESVRVDGGFQATDSNTWISGSTVTGRTSDFFSTSGWAALSVVDGSLYVAGTSARGGKGKPSTGGQFSCNATAGGAGLELLGTNPLVYRKDCEFFGGTPGEGLGCPTDSAPPVVVSAGQQVLLPGAHRDVDATPLVLPSTLLRLTIDAQPKDLVLPYGSTSLTPTTLPALGGPLLLNAFQSLPGPARAGGAIQSVDYAPQTPLIGGTASVGFVQALHVPPIGPNVLSSGSAFAVLETAAANSAADCNANGVADAWDLQSGQALDRDLNGVLDECEALLVLLVDDDAAGDPGPGDSGLSDPLEDGSPAHPFDAIQEAIDAVPPGEYAIIRLRDGRYSGAGNQSVDFAGRDLTVESENGPAHCALVLEGIAGGFRLVSGETPAARLAGLSFRRARASQGAVSASAVFIDESSPTLIRCRFEGLRGSRGPALFLRGQSHSRIESCEFFDNESVSSAGAVFVAGDSLFSSVDDYRVIEIVDCRFARNRADSRGGAVELADTNERPNMRFSNCSFLANEAGQAGGALLAKGRILIENCLFAKNRSARGGAIDCEWFTYLDIRGSTFARNRAFSLEEDTDAIRFSGDKTPGILRNSIFWQNNKPSNPGQSGLGQGFGVGTSYLVAERCIIEGGVERLRQTGFRLDAFECLDTAPRFVGPDAGDYRLALDSPAVDAGSVRRVPRVLERDLDGHPRLVGSAQDLGPYERQP